MVQAKFGLPQMAVRQLEIYTTAVLLATLRPPLPPRDKRFLLYYQNQFKLFSPEYKLQTKRVSIKIRRLVKSCHASMNHDYEITNQSSHIPIDLGISPLFQKKEKE